MTFAPTFQRVFRGTFDRAGAAVPWWLTGGIAAANCIAAYAPKGAADLAASYINLANPGTYNAAPGTAPTWDVVNGWIFNGFSQYLKTGIIPGANYTGIVRYSNINTGVENTGGIFGCQLSPTNERFILVPAMAGGVGVRYGHEIGANKLPSASSGVFAITSDAGYRNGLAEIALSAITKAMPKILIGCYSFAVAGGEATGGFRGGAENFYIQGLAIYDVTLIAPQVLALSTAMAAL